MGLRRLLLLAPSIADRPTWSDMDDNDLIFFDELSWPIKVNRAQAGF